MPYTNRLAQESSPYLLQHAHNPVDWYPWGEEAFAAARAADKPVLLSIGYSACHWCHVMERESFENVETAALMNDLFINVKVDREERPDVDAIYMQAVQMLTGSGGWPLTVFLDADGTPFFGGTYFPPEDRYGMSGFPTILRAIARAWRERRSDVLKNGAALREALRRSAEFEPGEDEPTWATLEQCRSALARAFDRVHGGFGRAPKFPAAMCMDFLLRHYARRADSETLRMVEFSLEKMARGGIYDQLGGGFHRYSVDDVWLVPHFEKMLYDNALLARVALEVWRITGNTGLRRVVEETLDYLLREMTAPEGAFYSTLDADSEGVEGKFYVWEPAEVDELLGVSVGRLFRAYYGITDRGNFEESNILHVSREAADVAASEGVSVEDLLAAIEQGRHALFEARAKRVRPGLDDKALTAWNALALRAFAEAGAFLERPAYVDVARRNAEFLLGNMRRDGRLLRTYKQGVARLNAYLEDYAYLIEALVSLYEATFEPRWIDEACALADTMIAEFWDENDGSFFFTGNSHEQLIRRTKEFDDNATPSGNSSAAWGLLRLAALTGVEEYRAKAEVILRTVSGSLARYARAFGHMLCAADVWLARPVEVAIVGELDDPRTRALVRAARRVWCPELVLAAGQPGAATGRLELLAGRPTLDGAPAAYVCRDFACQAPIAEPAALEELLRSSVARDARG
jgi:hypothetical protein